MDFKGVVVEKRFVANNFCDVVLRLENHENYDFKPGQFAFLTFTIEGKGETRAYSFASTPTLLHKEGLLEFGIKKKEGGKVSSYVCDKLKEGEIVFVSEPNGFMTLEHAKTKDYVFIAVGSGITPIKSIIGHLAETRDFNSATLIYGNKTSSDVAYHDFFKDVEKKLENFTYIPVLSREHKEGFYKGHVQDVLFSEEFDLVSKDTTYFLCGLPAMVFDVKEKLYEKGIPHENILFEAY